MRNLMRRVPRTPKRLKTHTVNKYPYGISEQNANLLSIRWADCQDYRDWVRLSADLHLLATFSDVDREQASCYFTLSRIALMRAENMPTFLPHWRRAPLIPMGGEV